MSDFGSTARMRSAAVTDGRTTVTELATRRRNGDVLRSITLVFGGVHYGTLAISMPYTKGKPIALYIVSQGEDEGGDDILAGPLDCLMTDDIALAADLDVSR
jgi:hypothetical protein